MWNSSRGLSFRLAGGSPVFRMPESGQACGLALVLKDLCQDMTNRERQAAACALRGYVKILWRWNAKLNLVAAADRSAVCERHLIPSLRLRPSIRKVRHANVLDVGSGAGFPGIPLAITTPASRFTLVESRRRRAVFLRTVIRELSLENTRVVNERIEDWRPGIRADVALARSVADPGRVADLVAHVLAHDGFLLVTLPPAAGPEHRSDAEFPCRLRHTFWQPFFRP